MPTTEVTPTRCPHGHPWRLDGHTFLIGWDNKHDPPCRVYHCQTEGCDGRWWVEEIRWREG
ncbi:hypothetical protein QSJ18_18100 [Gordonia sp. ABSL1-1]|uniref:hypothetical protein n=1 Tax=Gordonia sp. ABSL1-1 TaxID=3053923 RepID=UPI0025730EE2|nr:hypothetical protein [Gordonia sp. ABSL1-1]MDL9938662.1 hypothetical protein [Gordonia sp. ABSL1-1]